MERSTSKTMRRMLARGLRDARSRSQPSDGSMFSLFTVDMANGWYYQVDFIHDTRLMPKPYVSVFAFRPPRDFSARSADLYLSEML